VKRFLVLMTLAMMAAAAFGCAQLDNYRAWVKAVNDKAEECKDSIVYGYVPQADLAKGVLEVGLQFWQANEGYRKWAIELHEKAVELVDQPGITNGEFGARMLQQVGLINQWWGSALVLVNSTLKAFVDVAPTQPMDDCDKDYIRDFCKRRIEQLKLYALWRGIDGFFERGGWMVA